MDTSKHPEAGDTSQPVTASAPSAASRWPSLAQRRPASAPGSAREDTGEAPVSTVYVPPTRFHPPEETSLPLDPTAQDPAADAIADAPAPPEPVAPPPDPAPAADEPAAVIFERLLRHADADRPRPKDMPALFQRLLRN
ncbi:MULTISPECIES: hypothetical protein [unclassified Pigmentiphaga]|uniref:hypothetical protein n=1 Tax=unclassified Pigmentiphaga TaxID=2626614 RepID=UPI000B7197ED|nr:MULTISPECIES: hypothetical protein [unclassified Pigmentiphaga]OVZ62109.1 hypothetical protein CDO46_17685 [Pigmentiphaga sp. NML030171]